MNFAAIAVAFFLMLVGVSYVGHLNETENHKFQIECVQAGGTVTKDRGASTCVKDK